MAPLAASRRAFSSHSAPMPDFSWMRASTASSFTRPSSRSLSLPVAMRFAALLSAAVSFAFS